MSYIMTSYDANHAQFVNYNIGSVKYSELQALTGGTRTDRNGNAWNFTQNYSYTYGKKFTINCDTTDLRSNLSSVGLGSLDIGSRFLSDFPDNGTYYLQKNPTSTREYPEFLYSISESTSGGVTYKTHDLRPMHNSGTPNTISCSVTTRSDSANLNLEYFMSPLIVMDDNGKALYLGAVCGTIQHNNGRTQWYLSWNNDAEWSRFSNMATSLDSDPDLPIEGLKDYGQFTGDVIALPDAPDETVSGALGYGFLNFYRPSDAQLRSFGALLWTSPFYAKWHDWDSVYNSFLNAFSDPLDYIVGLFMLPVKPSASASSGIFLGGIKCNTVTAPKITNQWKKIDFGTININELYGNYLDYANSRISIYLPYIGTADLDVQEVNGGTVHLQYIVDCFTGACVANVHLKKATPTPWGMTYTNETVHSYTGNMAIQLPLSASSFDSMISGLVNVGLGLGTNNPATAFTGVKGMATGLVGDVTTRGSLSSNTGKLGYQTPYLMFTRPIEVKPTNLNNLHGVSAGVGGKLSSFRGYVVCSDVKLDGVTATDSELNEIETMLKTGVYV